MNSTKRDLIVLCTYNEIENLPEMIKELLQLYGSDSDILVVDDQSPDGTGKWATVESETEPRLKVINRKGLAGLGAATKDAILYFTSKDYGWMVQLDADFSHPLKYILEMRNLRTSGEVLLGSRYIKGGSFGDYPLFRQVLSKVTNFFFRFLLGIHVKDATQSFMMVSKESLQKINPSLLLSHGFPIFMELKYRYERQNIIINEIPIVIKDRERGETKMSFKQGWEIFKLFFRLKISDRNSVIRLKK
jgi:dolichol-phosphate mannosyltransferase